MFALVTSSRFGRKEKSKMFSQMQDARQDSYGEGIDRLNKDLTITPLVNQS